MVAHMVASAAEEFTAEARSCRAGKALVPEKAYRTVISVRHPILDVNVLLMENFAELAISQIISPDPKPARRNHSMNWKQKRLRSTFFSQ